MKDIYIGEDKLFDLLLLDEAEEIIPKESFVNIICHIYLGSTNTKIASYVLNSTDETVDFLQIQEGDSGLFIALDGTATVGSRTSEALMLEVQLYLPNTAFADGDKVEIMRTKLGVLKPSFKL